MMDREISLFKLSETKKKDMPLSVNILKLQNYDFDFLSIEEVIFFEYLVVKGKAFKYKEFYHSTRTIAFETGLKRTKLNSVISRFIELGIIKVRVKGMPPVKHFRVNYSCIKELIPKIYRLDHIRQSNVKTYKLFVDFYTQLADSYKQKNINEKNNTKNIKRSILKYEDIN